MTKTSKSSLKSQNLKWLVGLATLDAALVLLLVAPALVNSIELGKLAKLAIVRGVITAALPVLILLATGAVSHKLKAVLVYWRVRNALPGSRAFTVLGPSDARVDVVALQKNVGALPNDPAEQNVKWYKLYQAVKTDEAVVEAHRMYLMYRDMATMSLPLVLLLPVGLYLANASATALWIVGGLMITQFLLCAIAAQNSGVRLVCNVLALHSTKKITNAKTGT